MQGEKIAQYPNEDILLDSLKEPMEEDEKVLFAYIYGSFLFGPFLHGSDIDVAVYLKPSDLAALFRKEAELTTTLIVKLHNDGVDLRILNTLPFLLQYRIIKEGRPFFVRDEQARVDFETSVMNRFFQLKPYLDEYRDMLLLRIMGGKE